MSSERTDWIEFVPVWAEDDDAPEITIEILEPDTGTAARPPTRRSFVLIVTALLGIALGTLIAVIGAADGAVRLPGGGEVAAELLVVAGGCFAFLEAVVLVLALARPRRR